MVIIYIKNSIYFMRSDYMGNIILFKRKGEEHKMTINVHSVADYFLSIVDKDSGSSITHLKLQKLVYYAQAWNLVFTGEPMFDEEIEAWIHGPVCPELYRRFSGSGYRNLEKPDNVPTGFNKEQLETLEAVWESYGQYDGKYLEQLTHQELPWIKAREGYEDAQHCTEKIDLDIMKDYYTELNRD